MKLELVWRVVDMAPLHELTQVLQGELAPKYVRDFAREKLAYEIEQLREDVAFFEKRLAMYDEVLKARRDQEDP